MSTLFDLAPHTKAVPVKEYPGPLPVSMWAREDQPIEKFLLKGSSVLSDVELLAILIGGANSVDVARQLLLSAQNSLDELARMSVATISKVDGIGRAKAVMIAAALEVSRRRQETFKVEKPRISGSSDCYNLLKADLMDLPHEEFWVILLNRANRAIKKHRISQGGVSGTVADPRVIFKLAIEDLACAIVVAHNHPSGNLSPSLSDIELTKRLKEAGVIMEIQLLDHLIIGGSKYLSFADEGLLN